MKAFLLLMLALSCQTGLLAQKNKFVTVKAGNNIMDVLSIADVFYYPHFTDGKVFLRDGSETDAKLNYNRLFDEMQFIDAKDDTLALANEQNINSIVIGNDTFYYSQGYVRLLSSGDLLKVVQKQIWIISDSKQIGAYNSTNNTASITSYTSLNEHGRLYDLTVNEDLILKRVEQFYFGDKYNHFVLATKKNLLLLFPKEQKRIETFLKENKISLTNMDDLDKIVQFLKPL